MKSSRRRTARTHPRPLAAWVFLLRNPSKSAPLVLVIILAVLLIAGIVAIMNSIPLSVKQVYGYSRHITGISARGDPSMVPRLLERLQESPAPIERTVSCRTAVFNINSIVGDWPFVLYGLSGDDTMYVVDKIGLSGLTGRLPKAGEPEAAISRPLARNLGLRIGSALLRPDDSDNFSPLTVEIVGIYESDIWFSFTSYDYLAEHHFPPVDVLLVFAPDEAAQRELDAWALEAYKGQRAYVFAYPNLEQETQESLAVLFQILNLVIGMLVLVITLMMGMLISIHLAQREGEFGLLQAIGFTRGRLIRRAVLEAALVVVAGWTLGAAAAYGVLTVVKTLVMDPKAFALNPADPAAYLYTIPVPVAIIAAAALTVWFRFRRFDPISVIERRVA
ncbi:MAG: ABC transporter permease [Armatimonadetes bacterium]|nr:ABC transporter permease [Armatimonadota bacterium]